MPIESEEAFTMICSILKIEHIGEIMIVSDDHIRSMCPSDLAPQVINLKEKTIKKFTTIHA
jgi:hypothetical protein